MLETRRFLTQLLVDTPIDESDGDYSQGDFSLREAVEVANGAAGADIIKFDQSLFGNTITLTLGTITITDELHVQGPGASQLVIDGNANGALFAIDSAVTASLAGLRLTNGSASAVQNLNGDLTVSDVQIDNSSGENGGAIVSVAGSSLTVERSTLVDNTATGGGAIGRGGAIASRGALTVVDSRIADNMAGTGGGINHFSTPEALTVRSSTFAGNIATGGDGGAIYSDTTGTTVLRDSTIEQNEADNGGGVFFARGGYVINSTVSANSALNNGGGIVVERGAAAAADFEIRNSTIVLNQADNGDGGGIYLNDNGAILLHNDIVALNTHGAAGGVHDDIKNSALSQIDPDSSHNVIGVATGIVGISNGSNGNQIGAAGNPLDPQIDTLQFNGGLTQTHELLGGSPALNNGNPTEAVDENAVALVGDQRGDAFPRVVGTIDVGAFENGTVLDLGDAPSGYATLLADNGPQHVLGSGLALGFSLDADADGQPTPNADGDDTDGTDDEDGVNLQGFLVAGHDIDIQFSLTAPGLVSGWADFDGDGSFDASEQIITDFSGGTSTSTVTVAIPHFTVSPLVARFRVSSQSGLGPNGVAPDGEVEDYLWNVNLRDYGDAPAPYPTLVSDNGAIHWQGTPYLGTDGAHGGTSQDEEPDGLPSANADGDDTDNEDDEDGVTFPMPIRAGQLDAEAHVVMQYATGLTGRLNAWVDFNNDGSWSGPGEQIADDVVLSVGNNVVKFDVPSWAASGPLVSRWRINNDGGLLPTGVAINGEVEDHLLYVAPPEMSSIHFQTGQPVSALNAERIATADLDGDGDLDVVSANSEGQGIAVHANDGSQTFTAAFNDGGFDANITRVVDLDSDGDLDLLVADDSADTLLWYRNDGGLSFTQFPIASTLSNHIDIFSADLNDDGHMDIVSASLFGDEIVWFENDGNESFTQHTVGTADQPRSIYVADVNRDGDLDVLSASEIDDTIAWYDNNGSQSFNKRVITDSADGARSVFATDINGDGFLDVLSASVNDSTVAWHENDGSPVNGGWTEHVVTSLGAQRVTAADLDGDDDVDLLGIFGGFPTATIAWYENDGSHNFTERVVALPDTGQDVAAGDVDGDGILDVVAAGQSSATQDLKWYRNLPKTLVVDTLVDESDGDISSGDFSLREAVELSNTTPGEITIAFAAGLTGEITLGGTDIEIEDDVTIAGPGADVLTVSGDDTTRVFDVSNNSTVTIQDLTIADGHEMFQDGGGIRVVDASLTLNRVHVRDSNSNQEGGGVATANTGSLVIRDSTISNNTAGKAGGVWHAAGGTLTIVNSTISGNMGAEAGGVFHNSLGALLITNSTITGNLEGGGLKIPDNTATLNNSIVAGNLGFQSAPREFTGNAIASSANNLIGDAATSGGLTHGSNGNIVGNSGSGTIDINTVLDTTLQNNGGPTPTHALVDNSPARDSGDNALAVDENSNTLSVDQRGEPFDRIVGAAVDIGAFEALPAGLLLVFNTNDSGVGSLRQALLDANADSGTNLIHFEISGAGPHTIQPQSPLPTIADPVVIDGTSEPDFGSTPVIEIDGSSAGQGKNGLTITTAGSGSTIRGLAINRFSGHGVVFSGSDGNTIAGNYIGTNPAGDTALPNNKTGVFVFNSDSNTIGGTAASDRNVISGNTQQGIRISSGSTGNTVAGNYIGTNASGTMAIGNRHGVSVVNAPANVIGGTTEAARNVISGNTRYGVQVTGATSAGTRIEGNYIGTDATGTVDLGNAFQGVVTATGANNITIGGTAMGAGNVISGNDKNGIYMVGGSNNFVQGNLIGLNADGDTALGNTLRGVTIVGGGTSHTVGGTASGAGNVISANGQHGVQLSGGSSGNVVQGNLIGTDLGGTADLGNGLQAIHIINAPNNQIGGAAAMAGNVLSGNRRGVMIRGASATGNIVEGNLIGTDITGTADLGNTLEGVRIIQGASSNTIGGAATGAGNVIAHNGTPGNGAAGVALLGGENNAIRGNEIFDNAGLGIDLNDNGVTPNDSGDVDGGTNNLQNFPVITSAVNDGGNTTIQGTLNSAASTTFTLEFFSSPSADPSGNGEGQTFLGFETVNTNGSGDGSFSVDFSVAVSHVVTATTTDAAGNTSEFSSAVVVSSGMLLAAGGEAANDDGGSALRLTHPTLLPIAYGAIQQFIVAGFSPKLFDNVQFAIADLPGATLGLAAGNVITIDIDAAGHGWLVSGGQTAESRGPDDADLFIRKSKIKNQRSIDLLTAVMHELGHVAGLPDLFDAGAEDDLMYAWLETGVRKTSLEASWADEAFGEF